MLYSLQKKLGLICHLIYAEKDCIKIAHYCPTKQHKLIWKKSPDKVMYQLYNELITDKVPLKHGISKIMCKMSAAFFMLDFLIHQSVYNNVVLFVGSTAVGTLIEFGLVKLRDQTFQPLMLKFRRCNFAYHCWRCT